ncbi:MAG: HEAT repeat domain-containing protein [Phycisphaerales bacterium]|nr:HEAT repeat domain-containing protein [Phycisphaerales bacterium]
MSLAVRLLTAATAATLCSCVADDLNDLSRAFNAPTPAQAARDALDPYDPDKRREGVVLLATSTFGGAAPYMKLYRDYTEHDPDPLVKAAAITALGRHGTPEDAVLIAPWLSTERSSHQHVRWCAALALQRLHNTDVVQVLIRSVMDKEEVADVRAAGCVALGQYPEDRVVQALIAATDARALSISTAAGQSLNLLTGQTWGEDSAAWNVWYRSALADSAAFKAQQAYLYPTYSRDKVWWEHVAFWIDQNWEIPAPPAGLRHDGRRTTWGDDDEADG